MPHTTETLSLSKNRPKSTQAFVELQQVIPAGVSSPVRACGGMNMTPLVAEAGIGDLLVDLDGNCYIDYCLSWGALLHGHAHPQIIQPVLDRLKKGTSFGCTTLIEAELAKKIHSFMPSCEKVRFVSSGTEATMSAVRVARAFTKKSLVIKFSGNYHGHADSFLVQAGSGVLGINATSTSAGIPEEFLQWTACLPYNDMNAFDEFIQKPEVQENLACVIIEPIACNIGVVPADRAFLEHIRKKTAALHALLIFDEVITGFRVGRGGVQELYKITPDLTCLGKIVGGGMPCAAFGGRAEIMNMLAPLGPVYQAGTLSGNPVAVQAGLQSLMLLEEVGFYEKLQQKADLVTQPIKRFIQEKGLNCCIQQVGSAFTLFLGKKKVSHAEDAKQCNAAAFAELFRFLFDRGIYIPPAQQEAWFVSSAHTDDHLKYTADCIVEYLIILKKGELL